MSRDENTPQESAPEHDVLIGRLIDAEASPQDQRRFDELAAARPELWQALARRQLERELLAEGLDAATRPACAVDLPAPEPQSGRSLAWSFAAVGWAAAIILLVTWLALGGPGRSVDRAPSPRLADLTPDDHFDVYREAPFVLYEEAPMLLETVERPDGQLDLHVMRRIVERVTIDPAGGIPVDDQQHLTVEPAQLRKAEPARPGGSEPSSSHDG